MSNDDNIKSIKRQTKIKKKTAQITTKEKLRRNQYEKTYSFTGSSNTRYVKFVWMRFKQYSAGDNGNSNDSGRKGNNSSDTQATRQEIQVNGLRRSHLQMERHIRLVL